MKIGDYEVHPAAELFPLLPKAKLKELADDIKKHGLIHKIVLHNGKILDGRNRLLACELANTIPYFAYYRGEHSPTEYVIAANLKRRQLTPSESAAAATKAMPLLRAEAKERQAVNARNVTATNKEKIPESSKGQARDKAAELFGVNPRYVSDMERIQENAPKVFEQVANGEKSISAAKKELGWERPRQESDSPLDELKAIWRKHASERWRQCNKQEQVAFLKWVRNNK